MVTKKGSFVSADTQTMMHEGIKDLPIWQNKYFWEAAFFESVARERQNLADEYKVGHLNHLKWDDLSSDLQSLYTTKEADLLFGVLGRISFFPFLPSPSFFLSLSTFPFPFLPSPSLNFSFSFNSFVCSLLCSLSHLPPYSSSAYSLFPLFLPFFSSPPPSPFPLPPYPPFIPSISCKALKRGTP